jgi:hypothetical protein
MTTGEPLASDRLHYLRLVGLDCTEEPQKVHKHDPAHELGHIIVTIDLSAFGNGSKEYDVLGSRPTVA